jgi:hypothetical protein
MQQKTKHLPKDLTLKDSPPFISSSNHNKYLILLRKGIKTEYNGGRTEPDISNWILKKVGPPSTEVNKDELKEKIE